MLLVIFFSLLSVALACPDFGRICKPGEKGSPGIKYYSDSERYDLPYPFLYLGCGGKGKRFDTRAQGYEDVQKDILFCNGFVKSAGTCGTTPTFPGQPEKNECPAGYSCNFGLFFGLCCNDAASDRYLKNLEALKCPKGSKPYKDPEDKDRVFFGRSCGHKFCPKNSKCVQEEFEAYCCA